MTELEHYFIQNHNEGLDESLSVEEREREKVSYT